MRWSSPVKGLKGYGDITWRQSSEGLKSRLSKAKTYSKPALCMTHISPVLSCCTILPAEFHHPWIVCSRRSRWFFSCPVKSFNLTIYDLVLYPVSTHSLRLSASSSSHFCLSLLHHVFASLYFVFHLDRRLPSLSVPGFTHPVKFSTHLWFSTSLQISTALFFCTFCADQ